MKRTIALLCAVTLIAVSFTGCKKTIITDENGVSHVLVMKKGEPVQDEYGNYIEKYEDENGEKVTGPVTFPVVTKSGDNTVENAFIKLNVPEGWTFDERIKFFRIQHSGKCENTGKCEIYIEAQQGNTVEEELRRKVAAQEAANDVSPEEITSDIEKFDTKVFGIDAKAFKCRHFDNSSVYCYIFSYAHNTIDINFLVDDNCFGDDFNPEDFIKENMTLKTIPTEQ